MAIHSVERASTLLKALSSLSIKPCPINMEEFPAWRRKTEAELKVIGLDQYLLKTFREITFEEWKRKFLHDYEAEVQLLKWSGVSREEADNKIIPDNIGTENYSTTNYIVDFKAVKKVLIANGNKTTIKSLKKAFKGLLERKLDLISKLKGERAIAWLFMERVCSENHTDVIINENDGEDPYLAYRKLLAKQMQTGDESRNLFIAMRNFQAISMKKEGNLLEEFNKFIATIKEKARLINSMRQSQITDGQELLQLIQGLPDGKVKDYANLIAKTRENISFESLIPILSEFFMDNADQNPPNTPIEAHQAPPTMANMINNNWTKKKNNFPQWRGAKFRKGGGHHFRNRDEHRDHRVRDENERVESDDQSRQGTDYHYKNKRRGNYHNYKNNMKFRRVRPYNGYNNHKFNRSNNYYQISNADLRKETSTRSRKFPNRVNLLTGCNVVQQQN